jgi:peptide/nickel transport system substrate-binding protein
MRRFSPKLVTAVLVGCALALGMAGQTSAATPKRGGILNFVVGSKIPSYDLHKETTFSVPKPTNGGKTFTFKIRKGVKFHDGTPLTAKDIKATYDRIIFPPEGVPSARKAFFKMVSSVEAPDDYTFVVNLSFPSGAFIPALATPFNIIYSKAILDKHGVGWYAKNIMGSGPSSPRPRWRYA